VVYGRRCSGTRASVRCEAIDEICVFMNDTSHAHRERETLAGVCDRDVSNVRAESRTCDAGTRLLKWRQVGRISIDAARPRTAHGRLLDEIEHPAAANAAELSPQGCGGVPPKNADVHGCPRPRAQRHTFVAIGPVRVI
jgi:hypothetical protein